MTVKTRKKLIEVALPLEAINAASAREKSIRHGHPSTLHLWWARRPLAAARAVIFSQMVDDPSSHPEKFPTEEEQNTERERLFEIIRELVKWENTTNEDVLNQARQEIWRSWRWTCEDNKDHPQAAELFNPDKLPAFHDPFAGGGAIPLEAQRLGLESYASDLNPVAVLINKAMIEIPPKFAGMAPANPDARENKSLLQKEWKGAEGLAEDVRYYGQWMRDEAEKRIGHLYPKIKITQEMVDERPDLKPYLGRELTVIAWIWARTVKSPNPAYADVDVPLASTFMLSTKKGKEAYVEPVVSGGSYVFKVKAGAPPDTEAAKAGTSAGKRKAFRCLISDIPVPYPYIRTEAKAGRIDTKLMAVVAEGDRGRVYLSPTAEMEQIAKSAEPTWKPDCEMPKKHRNFQPPVYGMDNLGDIFTDRQLVALTAFSDLVGEARERVLRDAQAAGHLPDDSLPLEQSGQGSQAYADAIAVYLAFAVDKGANYWSSLCAWSTSTEKMISTYGRQALPMVWDFTEANPFSTSSGNFLLGISQAGKMVKELGTGHAGIALQNDASQQLHSSCKVISTDPPYYDNIGYADLSDFFYVWIRRSQRVSFPNLFATLAVPKAEELIAAPHRHGTKDKAEAFFLTGMTKAMGQLAQQGHAAFPVTIYYAFKQSERDTNGVASTGWETFLDAVIQSGFALTGTWPMRTEYVGNLKKNMAALASSIVLVCRPRHVDAPMATRQQFRSALKAELPDALRHLQQGNIAPVDLAQSAIGPGMAVYTHYARVVDPSGKNVSVRDALTLINEVLDETLAEQEGDFDADTQWAIVWFDQHGFAEGPFGDADNLARAKVTAVAGMMEAGILHSKGGKVRLLKPDELPSGWDPREDKRFTIWEAVHHMVKNLNEKGETGAAELLAKLGSTGDIARELAYRLYNLCERKKRSAEALNYNNLVQSWPEIVNIATANPLPEEPEQTEMSI